MNKWNWVLLALIAVLIVPNIFFLLQVWSVERHYRSTIEKIQPSEPGKEGDLARTEKDIRTVDDGSRPDDPLAAKELNELGLNELRRKYASFMNFRKRAWVGCQIGNVRTDETKESSLDPGGEQVPLQLVSLRVTTPKPEDPDEAQPVFNLQGTVYLIAEPNFGADNSDFGADNSEEPDPGAKREPSQFLGSFTVQNPGANSPTLELVSSEVFTDDEIDLLSRNADRRIPVTVYTSLPLSRDADFLLPQKVELPKEPGAEGPADENGDASGADSDADAESLLGEDVDAVGDADADTESPGNEERKDFAVLLPRAYRMRAQLHREIEDRKANITTLQQALEDCEKDKEALGKEMEIEKKRIAAMKHQAEELEAKFGEIEGLISEIKEKIAQTQHQNDVYAAEITSIHQDVANLINEAANRAAENVPQSAESGQPN